MDAALDFAASRLRRLPALAVTGRHHFLAGGLAAAGRVAETL